ncbi:hypothetical protein NDK43_25865 [Neobacillus pocheonensis]|uniref:Uncharacterized protein n=1 Tax=Neobacillus pocheonensis TaxID=363869 RepID=A0ABT0WFP9_9BACI|nr:hypothetical protein [Neobacillus pocheonensis]
MEKLYFRNVYTGKVLSESEYGELVEREARHHWEENLHDCREDYSSYQKFKEKFSEYDGDFVPCDEEGNHIDWEQY